MEPVIKRHRNEEDARTVTDKSSYKNCLSSRISHTGRNLCVSSRDTAFRVVAHVRKYDILLLQVYWLRTFQRENPHVDLEKTDRAAEYVRDDRTDLSAAYLAYDVRHKLHQLTCELPPQDDRQSRMEYVDHCRLLMARIRRTQDEGAMLRAGRVSQASCLDAVVTLAIQLCSCHFGILEQLQQSVL